MATPEMSRSEVAQKIAREGGFVEEGGRLYRMRGDDVQEAKDWLDAKRIVLAEAAPPALRFDVSSNPLGWVVAEFGTGQRVLKDMVSFDLNRSDVQVNVHGVVLFHDTETAKTLLKDFVPPVPTYPFVPYPFGQAEIDATAEEALQTIMRHGYTKSAVVIATEYEPGKFTLGFRFQDAKVGDLLENDDHTTSRVLAVIPVPEKTLEAPLQTFSWRAECAPDAFRFVEGCWDAGLLIKSFKFDMKFAPDVICEMESTADHAALLGVAVTLDDGHVMLETLRPCAVSENSFERDPLVRARLFAASRQAAFNELPPSARGSSFEPM